MVDEPGSANEAPGGAQPDAVALNAAFSRAEDSTEARDFLRQQRIVAGKQAQLLDRQIVEMEREDRLRYWSLRFGTLSTVMKAGFEIALAFIFLVIAAGIAAALWTASHDNSLVIEAFSVPPDMAARGLTGQAVAAQLQDKLAAMQDATDSARPANSYVNNWADDIKVQIPDTGVSIGEFYRFLAVWLGHQTHISGEVYRAPNGIAITARAGGAGGATYFGPEAKFGALLQQIAEAIYAHTQPYRYSVYIMGKSAPGDGRAILRRLSTEGETPLERAWAFNGLGSLDAALSADLYAAVADYRRAIAIKPDFAIVWGNLGEYETTLGHDESALDAYRKALPLFGNDRALTARALLPLKLFALAAAADELGDFQTALNVSHEIVALSDYGQAVEVAHAFAIEAQARLHDGRAAGGESSALLHTGNATLLASRMVVRFWIPWSAEDWSGVLRQRTEVEHAFHAAGLNSGIDGNPFVVLRARRIWPAGAYAFAMLGDFRAAHALIDRTPLDCNLCVRMRGNIDAAQKNWPAAGFWFADAVKQAPSIPFAYTDWGAMLLAKGDYDGAIAKFREANVKGPHFADPLEMWGEALMAKNRCDLALTKFEEANRYASNWGRLHLKWGEALMYAGNRTKAAKQFVLSATLDLSPNDRAQLARFRRD